MQITNWSKYIPDPKSRFLVLSKDGYLHALIICSVVKMDDVQDQLKTIQRWPLWCYFNVAILP